MSYYLMSWLVVWPEITLTNCPLIDCMLSITRYEIKMSSSGLIEYFINLINVFNIIWLCRYTNLILDDLTYRAVHY